MMELRSRLAVGLLVSAFVLGLTAPAMAADEKKKAAKPATGEESKAGAFVQPKVLIDNDKVRVTEVRYKPGEASDSRERGARVTRALTAGTMERTYPDGKKERVEWKVGETKWMPKATFANKNVGKSEVVLYTVTPK